MRVPSSSLSLILASFTPAALAQDPPQPIPWVVVDLHASIPRFPTDDQELAASRSMILPELPGAGLGAQIGLHVYPLHTRVDHDRPRRRADDGPRAADAGGRREPVADGVPLRAAEEKITSFAPQLSLNFGNGGGWSYLSAGLGSRSGRSADDLGDYPPNHDKLKTFNYGGGARWFIKPHLAFSFDARFYVISPGFAYIFPARRARRSSSSPRASHSNNENGG